MDEVYDQQITQYLQQVDENFVLANKAAALLLKRVKVFEQETGEVARCLHTWCNFFDLFNPQETLQEELIDQETLANEKNELSFCSENSSKSTKSNIPTPSMPKFSKSFHKTPMAQDMYANDAYGYHNKSFETCSTNLSRALQNITPPHTTPFYKPSKTPGVGHYGDETPLRTPVVGGSPPKTPFLVGSTVQVPVSAITRRSYILDSPSTPCTPEDGDYGPLSAKKSLLVSSRKSQASLLGTPAINTPDLILSSGTRAAISRHKMKNIAKIDKEDQNVHPNTIQDLSFNNLSADMGTPTLQGYDTPETAAIPNGKVKLATLAKNQKVDTPLSRKLALKLQSGKVESKTNKKSQQSLHSPGLNSEHEELLFDLAENISEKPPEFDISVFPKLFQSGEGAAQITNVYSKFHSCDEAKAHSLSQLAKLLPQYEKARIGLLLEMLVSRRFLRPFTNSGELFWRKC